MAYSDVLTGFNGKAARVGVTGAIRRAPLGTAAPVLSPNTKYAPVFKNLGYLSPDGVEVSFDEDTQEFIPWQELSAIRMDITKSVKTIKLTLWQFTQGNAELYFGLAAGTVKVDQSTGVWSFYEDAIPVFERGLFSLDVVDGDAAMRMVAFEAQVTSRDSIVLKRDEMVGLTVTLTIYPANSTDYSGEIAGKTTFWQFTDTWGGAVKSSTVDGSTVLTISTDSLAAGTNGTPYSATVAATGGTTPFTFAVSSGSLSDGLLLDASTGVISGTPSSTGSSTFTIKVTDANSLVATKEFTITVS